MNLAVFDNVGGETLENVLDTINTFGRIIACGSISNYNVAPEDRYPIRNLFHVVAKQLTFQVSPPCPFPPPSP